MDIIITQGENSELHAWEEMSINGKRCLSVYPLCECPEDAIIGRDLISCSEIMEYMREAYEAGRRGEEFNVHIDTDTDE